MRFKLPSFTLTVRDLTDEEWSNQPDRSRDYLAVVIKRRNGLRNPKYTITLVVGSPVYGGWDEASAARAAVSFASAPWCADDPDEREWMEQYGEDLSNEAFCHRILGTELRA